ncbi:heavy-metal-associated domain-containing protein [Sphingomonas sp. ID0503]|uniref:heavy-metal-associated domain-containing protein n=1 Tax=Sphingomonas sp. ID0503 TaxID=3399691 RepID=UPI003AFA7430
MTLADRLPLRWPIALVAALCLGALAVAQIETGDRGVPPIDSSGSLEVSGVTVDVRGKTAEQARLGGWREAQRRGWKMLYARTHGVPATAAPALSDGTLDSIVSGIIVENEQIGSTRYIATLGVQFDRARTGEILGLKGGMRRSPPMLVVPIQVSGGAAMVYEGRTEWQKAWARFRAGGSAIDYVRVPGTGADPVLLTAAQAGRPGRGWWRTILDQYGAADVVMPKVALTRLWPGGPVVARFTALHGPDAKEVASFTLRTESAAGLPNMLDEGIRRIDAAYAQDFLGGRLRTDAALAAEEEEALPSLDESMIEDLIGTEGGAAYTIQVDTPDTVSANAALAAFRGLAGVKGASLSSIAIGGVSLLSVTLDGDPALMRAGLAARGWAVEGQGTTLRIRRAAVPPPAAAPVTPPPPQPAAPAQP